jgi:hypothetical protein
VSDMTDTLARNRNVRYRNRLAEHADQGLFFAAFVLGGIVILAAKLVGMPQGITTSVPCLLIIAYAAIAWFAPGFRAREDKIAENCYYLGLLFTLVSLAAALYSFSTNIASTQAIITNFGVALATTIVGLALRVLISQMREDPVEFEREARLDLGEATSKLTAELHVAVGNFASFRRNMEETLEETMTGIVEKTTTALANNAAKFTDVGTLVIGKIDESFATFNAQSGRLNMLAGRTIEALEALFTRIKAIESCPDILTRKFDPLISGFRTLLQEAQARGKSQGAELAKIGALAGASLDVAARLANSVKEMETALGGGSRRMGHEMQLTAEAIGKVNTAVSGLAETAQKNVAALRAANDAMQRSLDSDLEAIRRRRDEMEAEVEAAQAMVKRVHRSLSSLADVVTENLSAKR